METFTFEWDGSHPATNFVNTLDERLSPHPIERLFSYEALVEFCRQARLIDDDTASVLLPHADSPRAQRVLSAALHLREALHGVLTAATLHRKPNENEVADVEADIRRAHAARHLILGESGFVWSWRVPDDPDRLLWELALAAESLLISEDVRRIKKCTADDCGVIFLDDSRAGKRRWCSMAACGNRYKVRRFRSTHAKSDDM